MGLGGAVGVSVGGVGGGAGRRHEYHHTKCIMYGCARVGERVR